MGQFFWLLQGVMPIFVMPVIKSNYEKGALRRDGTLPALGMAGQMAWAAMDGIQEMAASNWPPEGTKG